MVKFKKTICFDIDNVVCTTKGNQYLNSKPNIIAIKKINNLYSKGYEIKLFTARFMGRSNDNVANAKKLGFKLTTSQLKKWKVKYHKLIMGKPSYGLFIDDLSIYFKKNWYKDIDKYLL